MAKATHATIAVFRMDPAHSEQQRVGLEKVIVPGVRSTPGFVAGHWTLDRERAESTVMVLWTSAAVATEFTETVTANSRAQAAAGVELVSIRVVEVLASE
jgi:hypothetical protein